MTYRHTPDMGEISGFGGGYEKACQDMLEAGATWLLDRSAKAHLDMKASPQIFGILIPESDDAKALSKVITGAVEDCTGAMHHAVMLRLGYIAANGWDKYCEELRSSPRED